MDLSSDVKLEGTREADPLCCVETEGMRGLTLSHQNRRETARRVLPHHAFVPEVMVRRKDDQQAYIRLLQVHPLPLSHYSGAPSLLTMLMVGGDGGGSWWWQWCGCTVVG